MSGGRMVLVLAALAAALLVVELGLGARDYGRVELRPPCAARAPFEGGRVDGTVQRIVLAALDDAACELGTTRERLLLSLAPRTGRRFGSWSDTELERALRAGLVHAIDDAQDRGDLGSVEARVLRELAERAPVALVRAAAEHAGSLARLADLIL